MATAIAPPVTDTTEAFPELVRVRDLARVGDYAGLRAALEQLRERDAAMECTAASSAAEVGGLEVPLRRVLLADPTDTFARGLLGAREVVMAWEARSSLRAEHVTAEQFERFHAGLRVAEQHLIRACAERPDWSLPWSFRLATARGLQLGVIEARRRYDRLAEHHPAHLPGQSHMLQMVLPKWFGTWEEAFAFARGAAGAAPLGTDARTLPAVVHLEQFIDLDEKAGRAYLARPDVAEEIRAAAEQSVLHPDYEPGFSWITSHSLFAALHALAGRDGEAVPHFQRLGTWADSWVWGYLAGSRDRVNKVRAAALGRGGNR